MIQFIINWMARFSIVRKIKNPRDLTYTQGNSTKWTKRYRCVRCGTICRITKKHCPECLCVNSLRRVKIREIWDGKRWQGQVRYGTKYVMNDVNLREYEEQS